MLHWKRGASDEMMAVEYTADYRGCQLRIVYMGSLSYTAFVQRHAVLCIGYFKGRGALHRARLAAPKLANVMIQRATHHESKGRK
jgi:hypothetical protein